MDRPDFFIRRQCRARPLACASAAFLLGLIAARRHPLPALVCLGAFAALAALGIALRSRRRAVAACLLLAAFAAGMGRMALALDAVPQAETMYSVEMVGRVISEPKLKAETGRLISRFQLESIDGERADLRVRLYLRDDEPVSPDAVACGQRLRLTGHIWRADPATNPCQFDFAAWLRRQGLSGYATARLEDVTVLNAREGLDTALIDARRAFGRRIDALFPRSAPLVRALVLGDRSELDDEFRESLNRTGTAHLISISGLHVTVLAAFIALLLGLFMPRRRANLIAVLLLIPYGALIGFNAPFVRALAMFALLSFAPVAGYPSDPVTRLCAVMLGYLLAFPLAIEDAGFVLSFAASAGILLLMPPLMELTGLAALRRRRPDPNPVKRVLARLAWYFPTLLCASLAAQLATLPAVVAFFGVQSVISLPFNLICVPLCMIGYILAIVALLLSALYMPLAALAAKLPDALFALLTAITAMSARLPVSGLRFGRYPALLVLAHWSIVLAASHLSRIALKWRKWMPFALIVVAALSALVSLARAWPLSIAFLDAGQADCAVLRSKGHTCLFDVGDDYTPAPDYLNATCLSVDAVFLSHPHHDHAGGLKSLLASFRPGTIYVPAGWFDVQDPGPDVAEGIELARSMGVEIVELSAGDVVKLPGDITVEVIAPDGSGLPDEVNDMSMVALVTCAGQRALFTGDISEDAEPDIVPDADILKVAHHGSARATSARFLAACSPEIAVISVGENNFGHPDAATLDKLADAGAKVLTTRDCGAITLTRRGDTWRIDTYLEAPNDLE